MERLIPLVSPKSSALMMRRDGIDFVMGRPRLRLETHTGVSGFTLAGGEMTI